MIKTFAINTLGCKVNQYETRQMRRFLESMNLVHAPDLSCADLVVVNTCCVTHNASAKSRRSIRRAAKLNPSARIVVVGCLAALNNDELKLEDIHPEIVAEKDKIAAKLYRIVKNQNQMTQNPGKRLLPLREFVGQTRAFLKVQDGCDGFCSYCIIPRTRKKVHSRDQDEIIEEANALVGSGHKEIVVTGIFLGAYGKPTVHRRKWSSPENTELIKLISRLVRIEGLKRIRLSSLEPADVTETLLKVMAQNDNLMPHLHLSLQSGSNDVLRKMHRQYNAEQFCQKVELAKNLLDEPALTADLIVGFPGESEQDFRLSSELMSWAQFAKTHVFTFSARAGTAAAKMSEKIEPGIIKARAKSLRKLDSKLQAGFRDKFIGRQVSVLVEKGGAVPQGRCRRYFKVKLPKANVPKNTIVNAEITENASEAAIGKFVSNA